MLYLTSIFFPVCNKESLRGKIREQSLLPVENSPIAQP